MRRIILKKRLFGTRRPNEKKVRVLLWCCILATLAAIFFFSAQAGSRSTQTSGLVVKLIIRLFYPDYDTYTAARQSGVFAEITQYVRKGAHFLEYMTLGFLLTLLLKSYGIFFAPLCAWLGSSLYACTDELHQTLVSARAGTWWDVLLDSGGGLTGVLAAMAVAALIRRRQKAQK